MKTKSKVSQREVWLLAMLPAALVVIVSFALPSPADEVTDLEQRLERISSNNDAQALTQMREFSQQLKQSRQKLETLETREAELSEQIWSLTRPTQRRMALNMAGVLDELARRLSGHGAQVLAMEAGGPGTSGARPANRGKGQPAERGGAGPREWVVGLVATWPVLHAALADAETFPQGLVLSAMKMEPDRLNGSLRRWELIVTVAGPSL